MQTWVTEFDEYDTQTNDYTSSQMQWEAEDALHAINQLVDFYKDYTNTRIGCIQRVHLLNREGGERLLPV